MSELQVINVGGGLTDLPLDPMIEMLYNLCAECRVPKVNHPLQFACVVKTLNNTGKN